MRAAGVLCPFVVQAAEDGVLVGHGRQARRSSQISTPGALVRRAEGPADFLQRPAGRRFQMAGPPLAQKRMTEKSRSTAPDASAYGCASGD